MVQFFTNSFERGVNIPWQSIPGPKLVLEIPARSQPLQVRKPYVVTLLCCYYRILTPFGTLGFN